METVVQGLVIISAADLLLNFFFHLVQFKRYCNNEIRHALNNLIHRLDGLDRKVSETQRDVQEELHQSIQLIKRKISEDGIKEEEEDGRQEYNEVLRGRCGGEYKMHTD